MKYFAIKNGRVDGKFHNIYGTRFQTAMCTNNPKQDVVEIDLIEDPWGDYYGWRDASLADRITMIHPHKSLFEICFPYGVEEAVAAGRGTIVRLKLVETEK